MDRNTLENTSSSDSEKHIPEFSVDEVHNEDADEALRLVGLERAGTYTEEQYNRVKRRLVRVKLSKLSLRLILCHFRT